MRTTHKTRAFVISTYAGGKPEGPAALAEIREQLVRSGDFKDASGVMVYGRQAVLIVALHGAGANLPGDLAALDAQVLDAVCAKRGALVICWQRLD